MLTNISYFLLFLFLNPISDKIERKTYFEDNNYSIEFETCGSDLCNTFYVKNKKTNYSYKLQDVFYVDTLNYKFVCVEFDKGLNVYDFNGSYLKFIELTCDYPRQLHLQIDNLFFDKNYLIIYWQSWIEDPRYKGKAFSRFLIDGNNS